MTLLAAVALAAGLSDCDAAVRDRPDDYGSYDCYRTLARSRQMWDGAVERLEALLAREPRNTLARVVLARIESDRGRPRAEDLFRTAAVEFAASAMPVGEVFARLDLAFLLRRKGRLEDAESEVERARVSAQASGLSLLLANVRAEEAWIALARADPERAYGLFRETEAEVFPTGPLQLQDSVTSGIGETLWTMGRFPESVEYYRRLAAAHAARGDRYEEAGDRYNVALLSGRLKRDGVVSTEEFMRIRDEALTTAIEGGNRRVESAVRQMIAEDEALPVRRRIEETERALTLAESVGDEKKALFSLRELARLRLSAEPGRPAEAYRLADEAVRRARRTGVPAALARGLIRRAQIAWVLGPRDRAIAEAQEAFDAIEQIRDLPHDELVRARLSDEWALFYYQISGALLSLDPAERGDTEMDLAFSVMERLRGRVLLEALDAAGVGVPEQSGRIRPSLSDVRGELGPDEALVAFQITQPMPGLRSDTPLGRSFVLVLTRGSTTVHPVPDEDSLASRVSLYLAFVGRRDGSDLAGATELRHDLLDAALADLPVQVRRLVVVPDKVLFRMPFDALVGDRYQISIAPSAAVWLRWRHAVHRVAPVPALVLADPELGERSPGPLPHARSEARSIVRALGSGSTAVVGREASEAYLTGAPLSRYRIVHFAAHAVIDDAHPERSALLLAPGDEAQDGPLNLREIAGLDLDGAVVVLAACRGSAGRPLAGEGPMSLARGFFQAGARAVVGSLLPLRDDEAAAFVEEFYRRLAGGESVGAALVEARRALMTAGAPTAAWAGWVAMGDARVVPAPGGARHFSRWGSLLAVLLLITGLVAVGARIRSSMARST